MQGLHQSTGGRLEVASHVQAHRRQPDRAPGVLNRAAPGSLPKRLRLARSERELLFSRWRMTSGVLFILFAAMLVVFFTSDVFYVRAVQVQGNNFMSREEVFAYADIADYHMFWLDPETIRANILRSSSVADLSVAVGWPPNLITINLQERQPAIVWADAGNETWIDLQGRVMRARSEMPNLLHVNLARGNIDGPKPRAADFDADMVLGALRLQEILPVGEQLSFDPVHGLGWTNESGWQVWMGADGASVMNEKIEIYNVLAGYLNSRAIDVAELNIANPDAPFYRLLWGR